jgi:hypothetical protein
MELTRASVLARYYVMVLKALEERLPDGFSYLEFGRFETKDGTF